jgi:hypothetical protein
MMARTEVSNNGIISLEGIAWHRDHVHEIEFSLKMLRNLDPPLVRPVPLQ